MELEADSMSYKQKIITKKPIYFTITHWDTLEIKIIFIGLQIYGICGDQFFLIVI